MVPIFFRFYNLPKEKISEFIKEIQLISEPIIKKIVKTEIVNTNKSMNFMTTGAEIKEARFYFNTVEESEEFHGLEKHLRPIYQKYTDMSDISKGADIHRRYPKDIVF